MRAIPGVALITLALALVSVAIGLSLRTASKTINYPPYSSLDNGEQGLRAFYETARRLDIPVARSYKSLSKTVGATGTLLYTQTDVDSLREEDEKELELYERVAKPGTRLVFLINEFAEDFVSATDPKAGKAAPNPADSKDAGDQGLADKKKSTKIAGPKRPEETLRTRWGVELKYVDRLRKKNQQDETLFGIGNRVTRHWSFSKWSDHWKPTGGPDGAVYMLERSAGSGSLVLLLGLESFTNKTLLTKVDSPRIASTLSGPRPLIFDEGHLGVADDDTVAGYARQHHLEWLLLGLLILAGLYVWRSTVSFVPALPENQGAEIAGREAHMALTSLLSQSIKRADLPREIIAAWRDSVRMLSSAKIHLIGESLEEFSVARDSMAPVKYVAVIHAASRRGRPP
jgi:hypothetical protein